MQWIALFMTWILLAAPFVTFACYLALKAIRNGNWTPFLLGASLIFTAAFFLVQLLRYRYSETYPLTEVASPLAAVAAHLCLLAAFTCEGKTRFSLGRRAATLLTWIGAAAVLGACAAFPVLFRTDLRRYIEAAVLFSGTYALGVLILSAAAVATALVKRAGRPVGPFELPWMIAPFVGLLVHWAGRWALPDWKVGGLLVMQLFIVFLLIRALPVRVPGFSIQRAARKYGLSERESALLVHVREGKSNKEIAAVLNISESAVKKRVRAVLRKTSARNRIQLIKTMER
jgi:DNA-binding CsgD family transcriptional regulator